MDWLQRAKRQGRWNGRAMYYSGLITCGMALISPIVFPKEIGKEPGILVVLILMGIFFAFVGKRFAMWGDRP